jgi:hypothetical protein
MSNENEIPNIFSDLINGKIGYSESDIISMYIDGRISKNEYIRRMNEYRGHGTSS